MTKGQSPCQYASYNLQMDIRTYIALVAPPTVQLSEKGVFSIVDTLWRPNEKNMEGKQTVPLVMLNSGKNMPVAGFGTVAIPLPPNEELTSIFMDGIEAGYRHFDTAAVYGTERALGEAIRKAVEQGLVRSREEIFVTSKLWCSDAHHDLVLPALRKTLENLGLDYVDLYLIHWPVRLKQSVHPANFAKKDLLPFDIKGTWEAMHECQKEGLTKSIGVSNYGIKKLSQLLDNATIPPAVNQVEMNPAWQQTKLRAFCKEKGILVSAWSPLGAYKAIWGTEAVMENPILKEIATARNKSVAQIALRWAFEQGISFVVKSFNKERMKHNLEIFDFELSQQELEKISQIPQHRMYKGEQYVSENGPHKSLEELWDGEP